MNKITIEKEAEMIYGKKKPNAEKMRKAVVSEKKRLSEWHLRMCEDEQFPET